MDSRRQWDGTWVYPPIGEALKTVGLDDIGVYIAHRQNTITQYIATNPIMDLCLSVEWNMVLRLSRRWREKPALDILGIRVGHAAARGGGGVGGRGRCIGVVG